MGFGKVIGEVVGGFVGAVVGTVVGGVTTVVEGAQTGNWKEASDKWGDTITEFGEGGAKIGGECEKVIESAVFGAATFAGGHAAKKLFDDKDKSA